MENLTRHYLQILDIDPNGGFIRLINTSRSHTIDLNGICIRQTYDDNVAWPSTMINGILNNFQFDIHRHSLLRCGRVTIVYSAEHRLTGFELVPYHPNVFLAYAVRRWFTDAHVKTELQINDITFHSYKPCFPSDSDVPVLFHQRMIPGKQNLLPLPVLKLTPDLRGQYPYCLDPESIVNPHTQAMINDTIDDCNEQIEFEQIVENIDSCAQDLIASERRINLK